MCERGGREGQILGPPLLAQAIDNKQTGIRVGQLLHPSAAAHQPATKCAPQTNVVGG